MSYYNCEVSPKPLQITLRKNQIGKLLIFLFFLTLVFFCRKLKQLQKFKKDMFEGKEGYKENCSNCFLYSS